MACQFIAVRAFLHKNGRDDRRTESGRKCNDDSTCQNEAEADAVKFDQALFIAAAVVEAEHRCDTDTVAEVQGNEEKLSIQDRRDGSNADFSFEFQHQHIKEIRDNGRREVADHLGGTVEAALREQAFGKLRPGEAETLACKGKV